jgi:hypothetical protein
MGMSENVVLINTQWFVIVFHINNAVLGGTSWYLTFGHNHVMMYDAN